MVVCNSTTKNRPFGMLETRFMYIIKQKVY